MRNKVILALAIVGAAATGAAGFVTHAPNRLLSGQPIALWDAAGTTTTVTIGALGLGLVAASFLSPSKALHQASGLAGAAILLLVLHGAGQAAASLAGSGAGPAARTSAGPAFWILALCAALVIVDAMQRLGAGPGTRVLVAALLAGGVALMAAAGSFDALSLAREYAGRRDVFSRELGRHCLLVLGALLPALLIGVPLGLAAARRPRLRNPVFATLNLVQTVPSIALFGLLIGPLSALASAVPALAAIGVRGIGFAPAVVALTLYSLLPVARNTEAGIAGVDPDVVETALGMGFTRRQVFWRVELPLALPVFLAGLRIVTVQAIGLAVVAALIGAGGLGAFVFQGLGQSAVDLILLGAVPTILLALATDFALRTLIDCTRRAVP